ncbi:MAG: Membrane-bound lytic murein transglycosylase F [Candidatus Celerinatantimonas neptuna]|nr:MAG: Membrane-bound lytic murein transglycosylase F [Candidatus Celerinatantimonas neptuna]
MQFKLVLILILSLFSLSVQADLWYRYDSQGKMFFANHQKGPQWKLLMRNSQGASMPARFRIKSSKPKLNAQQFQNKQTSPFGDNAVESKTNKHPFARLIKQASKRYKIPVQLLKAVIAVESSYRHKAVSKAGAMGLMQLMPKTARRFSVKNPFDPAANIDAGSRYLRLLINQFQSVQLALAAYNAGENAVKRYNGIPPYQETQHYVKKVMSRWDPNNNF